MKVHASSKDVQACCAAALSTLTVSPANRVVLIDAGVIEQLVAILGLCIQKASMVGTFKNAAWGLARLVINQDALKEMVDRGVVAHLAAGLRGALGESDGEAEEAALRTCTRLLKQSAAGKAVLAAMRQVDISS